MINGMIKFIREKGIKPSCKLLSGETVFMDFTTAGEDTTTIDSARDIVNTKMPADHETSSVISLSSNTTGTSAYQKEW